MRPSPRNLLLLFTCFMMIACNPTEESNIPGSTSTPNRYDRLKPPSSTALPTFQSTLPIVPPVPTVIVPTAIAADLADIWGKQINIIRIPMMTGQSYRLGPNAVTPDGKYLVCVSFPPHLLDDPSQPAKVVLVDLGTLKITEIRDAPLNGSQPYEASADDNWIVWTEAPQEPGFFSDWVIYAYNRNDHSIKEVGKAPRRKLDSSLPVRGPDGTAQLDHGIVVWSEGSPDIEEPVTAIVKSMDLATGKVEVLTQNGLIPRISWPYIAWAERQEEPSTQITGPNKGVIVVLDLRTGTRKKLLGPDTPKHFAIHNGLIAWVTAQGKEVLLTDVDETFRQTIAYASGDDIFEHPSLNDRLVTWQANSRPQVWDQAQKRLVTLENDRVFTYFISRDRLVWLSPIPGGDPNAPGASESRTINVLDTTQLRK